MSLDFDKVLSTPGGRRDFGALIRNKRWSLDMEQGELAEKAECMPHQVQDAEVGRCYLPGVLRRIAGVLSLEPAQVV